MKKKVEISGSLGLGDDSEKYSLRSRSGPFQASFAEVPGFEAVDTVADDCSGALSADNLHQGTTGIAIARGTGIPTFGNQLHLISTVRGLHHKLCS